MSANTKRKDRIGHEVYIPIDKQSQLDLLNSNQGHIRVIVDGGCEDLFVDSAPLVWEHLDDDPEEDSVGEAELVKSNSKKEEILKIAIEVMAPILEDVVLAGVISQKHSFANSNKSVYFKLFHLYVPKERNGPSLARKMGRPRSIPERYAVIYRGKIEKHQTAHFSAACCRALQDELAARIAVDGVEDGVLDLYAALKSFLAALIAASPWDSESRFDICRELYVADGGTRGYKKAIRLLKKHGCSVGQIRVVTSLIAKCKKELEV